MSTLFERLRPIIDSRRADVLLALVVLVAVELGVWLQEEIPGGKPLSAVALGVAAIALAWRRRFPLATLCVVVAGDAVPTLVAWETPRGGAAFIPFLFAVYSVARHAPTRRGVLGLVVAEAGVALNTVLDPSVDNFDSASWQATVTVATWLSGFGLRIRKFREEERAVAVVADERARIARELHDVVAHSVSVIAVQAGAALEVLDREPERAREPLVAIEASARQALSEMRRLLGVLRAGEREDSLAPQPGLAELPALVEQVRAAGVPCELEVEGEPVALEPGIDLSAYRIVQEALTNALKHAGPAHASVRVRYGPQRLELEIEDDGAGSAEVSVGSGHGLIGMRERVALYRGRLETGRRPEGGYVVRVELPVERVAG